MNWKFLFILFTPFVLLFGCVSYINNYEPEEKTWPAESYSAPCYENEEFGCYLGGGKYLKEGVKRGDVQSRYWYRDSIR